MIKTVLLYLGVVSPLWFPMFVIIWIYRVSDNSLVIALVPAGAGVLSFLVAVSIFMWGRKKAGFKSDREAFTEEERRIANQIGLPKKE